MALSRHGELRARKRLGVSKQVADKLATEAYTSGQHIKEFTGFFKKYLNYHARYYRSVVRVHKMVIYFFDHEGMLITCWQVPNKHKKSYLDRANVTHS